MTEIADCMNDLNTGAVWRGRNARTRLAKISSVSEETVRFYIWDSQGTEEERDAWSLGKVMKIDDFLKIFEYASEHVINNVREHDKTAYLAERALSKILDLMTDREEALDLLTTYTKLVRRRAGYDVVTHEWDEGCAGVGCCADTAEMGGDMLIDQTSLTAEEIEGLTA